MFNFTEIAKYVEETKDSWGLLPIAPLNVSNHASFVDAVDFSIVNDINGTQLILSIPFVNRNTYDIHYVHTIPMFVSSDSTFKTKYSVNVEYPIVLISSDKRYFSLQNHI